MHHIFKTDGKAVLVAMDHARLGNSNGPEDPRKAVARVVEAGGSTASSRPRAWRARSRARSAARA
jgi:DhnA family fructose-bisphosphate aldolase class Ia